MGWFQVVRDWRMVKKEKEGLMDALRQTPPGAGVSIKNPHDPVVARALIEILKENPNSVEIMDFGFEVTLMRKIGMIKSMSAESYDSLRTKHQILSGDSVVALDLDKGHELPAHKLRSGIPDDMLYKGDE